MRYYKYKPFIFVLYMILSQDVIKFWLGCISLVSRSKFFQIMSKPNPLNTPVALAAATRQRNAALFIVRFLREKSRWFSRRVARRVILLHKHGERHTHADQAFALYSSHVPCQAGGLFCFGDVTNARRRRYYCRSYLWTSLLSASSTSCSDTETTPCTYRDTSAATSTYPRYAYS
jgi:hypothetical protein